MKPCRQSFDAFRRLEHTGERDGKADPCDGPAGLRQLSRAFGDRRRVADGVRLYELRAAPQALDRQGECDAPPRGSVQSDVVWLSNGRRPSHRTEPAALRAAGAIRHDLSHLWSSAQAPAAAAGRNAERTSTRSTVIREQAGVRLGAGGDAA